MRVLMCALLALVACGKKSQFATASGRVRIVIAEPFVETDGFVQAVAAGRPFGVSIVRENAPADTAAAELTLSVEGGAHRIAPLGAGQAIVWLDAEGDYSLSARRDTGLVASEPLVRSRQIKRIRAYAFAQRRTFADGCEQSEDIPFDALTLAPNQELRLPIIAVDATEQALSGWLSVVAESVPASLSLEATSVFAHGTPNTFVIRPVGTLGGALPITLRDMTSQTLVQLSIATTADVATCTPPAP
jgi:hypothetical protein